jgi:hypothetical protein
LGRSINSPWSLLAIHDFYYSACWLVELTSNLTATAV